MTSLAREQAEQARWEACLRMPTPAYGRLVANEFLSADKRTREETRLLARMLRFAGAHVPYYCDQFRRVAIDLADDPAQILARLPVLTKRHLLEQGSALQAEHPLARVPRSSWRYSSGTTGRPVAVLHGSSSLLMFALLKQREYRWFRLNPSGTLAAIRLAAHLPRGPGGAEVKCGETVRIDTWPYMERFITGPAIGLSALTPVDERISWLRAHAPDYLLTYSETLEHLAFAAGDGLPAPGLKSVIAISEQLTPNMRDFVEGRFQVAVHQNYGLNEIGLVAVRCESGRYHVHSEQCRVEIVDDAGAACAPGCTGRLLVTGLTNFAMPLIRYDTSDLAEAVEGPCPCNRTMASFGDIVGRYSRVRYLPAGTIGPVMALRDAIERTPPALISALREFQIHQFRSHGMELRLVTRAPMPEAFFAYVRDRWAEANGAAPNELVFRYVDEIPRLPGGKFQVFTSDFMPPPDSPAPSQYP
jgi:phenylacetate-coenzyme A ligase PaaK-like adenylate-forming protein